MRHSVCCVAERDLPGEQRRSAPISGHRPQDCEHQFHRIASILRRRSGLVVSITVVGTLVVGATAVAIPPSYTSTAEVIVDRASPARGAATAEESDEAAIDTQVAMLTSEAHLRRVLASLATRPDLKKEAVPPSRTAVDRWRIWLHVGIKALKGALPTWGDPEVATGQIPSLAELRRALKVNKERRSWIITVSYTDRDPERAATIANEVLLVHIGSLRDRTRREAERVVAWLDGQIAQVGAAWKQADTALRRYRVSHGASNADVTEAASIAEMRRQLVFARADRARRQQKLDRLRELERRGAGEDAFAEVLGDPAQSGPAVLRLAAPASGRSPQPWAQIAERIERATRLIENETQVAGSRVETIEKHLADLQKAAAADAETATELHDLERRADSAAKLLEDLLRRRQASVERRDLAQADLHVVAPAWTAERPSTLNPLLFIPPALIAFSLFGGILAVTLDRLDHGLRGEREVADALGIPCTGLIPEIRDGRRAFRRAVQDPSSTYSQAIQSVVVAGLQLTGAAPKRRLVLITSSLPGEGKTTLAVGLAACAARLGRRVLLIDLGLHRHRAPAKRQRLVPADSPKLPLHSNRPGHGIMRMADLAIDHLLARDIGLDQAGSLSSKRTLKVLHQLRASYDYVIIDAPPVFAAAETRMLASVADEVIVAVRWGATRREVARNVVERLHLSRPSGSASFGDLHAVLTRANLMMHARYRYGDAGEFLKKYARRYARRAPARAADVSTPIPTAGRSP